MGNGTYGQCRHRGQWGTGGMGHMANEAHRGKVVQGVWGTWAIGTRGNGVQEVWGIWAMRPTGGMGYKGYGPHGQ